MRKPAARAFLTVICICLLQGCAGQDNKAAAPPLIIPESNTYQTVEVKRADINDTMEVTGNFTSAEEYTLSFEKRGGYLKELIPPADGHVRAGDILAAFDTGDIEKRIEQQSQAVIIAQIDYDNAKKQIENAKSNLANTKKTITAGLELAKAKLQKATEDFQSSLISELDFMEAKSAYEASVGQLERQLSQAEYDAGADLDKRALASFSLAEMQLRELQEELEGAVIKSPIDGRVTALAKLSIGDYVQARQPVFTVVDDSDMVVTVKDSAKLNFQPEIQAGQAVELKLGSARFSGTVVIAPSGGADGSSADKGALFIRPDALPSGIEARMGERVTVIITRDSRSDTIVVPLNAVSTYDNYQYVQVLVDMAPMERVVTTGLSTSAEVEILSGLAEGELLIVR